MPTSFTDERWDSISAYTRETFGREDDHLAGLMTNAVAQGLPDISVSAEIGRLLMMLTSMTRGRTAIEVGTLGGYSGIWIVRGLRPDGHLHTIESEPKHAAFASEQFELAGVTNRVTIHRGKGLDVLPTLAGQLGERSVDVAFVDAVKAEYPDYWTHVRPLIAPGGLILADNVLGTGSAWSIDDESHPNTEAMTRFNRAVADDPDFEAVIIPFRLQGLLVGRRSASGVV